MLCIAFYSVCLLLIFSDASLEPKDYFWFIPSFIAFFPLVLVSSILGRVPFFITKHIPQEMEEDLTKAESFFTEFSAKSIWFAIGFFTVVAITVYYWG